MLDDFWSLQYMIPAGVLNGFAGALQPMQGGTSDHSTTFTHALHLRFQSMQVTCSLYLSISMLKAEANGAVTHMCLQHVDKFRQHEKLQQARQKAGEVCQAIVECVFLGQVPKDLGHIFRRGAEWDLGVDHILLLQARHKQLVQHSCAFVAAQLAHHDQKSSW